MLYDVKLAPGVYTVPTADDRHVTFVGGRSIGRGLVVPPHCSVTFDRASEEAIIVVELVTKDGAPHAGVRFVPRRWQLSPGRIKGFSSETYRRRAICLAAVPRDDPTTAHFGQHYQEAWAALGVPKRRRRVNVLKLRTIVSDAERFNRDPVRAVMLELDCERSTAEKHVRALRAA